MNVAALRAASWPRLLVLLGVALVGVGPCDVEVRRADVNLDGYVDIYDATLVGTCLALPPGSDPRCARADVDGDGDVDADDFVAVQQHFGAVLFDPAPPGYVPASVHVARDGVIHLHDPGHNRIQRWSLPTRRPLAPILLGSSSRYVAYSRENDSLYVAYQDRRITRIDASFPAAELPFATLPSAPVGLTTAGAYVVAVGTTGTSYFTFAPDGQRISSVSGKYLSSDFAWSDVNRRLYHFRDTSIPNDLMWEAIDPAGHIIQAGESPYHGDYTIAPPVRVSRDGARVLLGSGDFYDGISLKVVGTLPARPVDALWLEGRELLTLEASNGGTLLRQWGREPRLYREQRYDGQPLRVFEWTEGIAVLTLVSGTPIVHDFVPTNDADGDGVANLADAFPLDPAASQDSDGDGYPDAWNPGYGPEDSTDGLHLDGFPQDPTCQLPEHARPGHPDICDLARSIPVYTPSRIEIDEAGTIYMLSPENRRIYRWSLAEDYHVAPIQVADAPKFLASSSENGRVYVGYANSVTQIDPTAGWPQEAPFASFTAPLYGVQTFGHYVLAAEYQYFYSLAPDGSRIQQIRNFGSPNLTWNAAKKRMYSNWQGSSPDNLQWQGIDPTTGRFGSSMLSPYHGDYPIVMPIRVSQNGAYVLLGSGDVYSGDSLALVASLPVTLKDALWLPDGTLVTVRDGGGGRTLLEHWDTRLERAEYRYYPGAPLRILFARGEIAVVTLVQGRPAVDTYVPTDDTDGDGVANREDAFPLDPAASRDSDGDGYPDAWNPGYGPDDSTDGLALDAFPLDSACHLAEDARPGQPAACDIARAIPVYTPTRIEVDENGTLYLLSPENDRIYRWSFPEHAYENPIVVGDAPNHLAYSAENHRLYVGYDNGVITEMSPDGPLREQRFTAPLVHLVALQTAGRFVFAVDGYTHHTFAPDGTHIGGGFSGQGSAEVIWSAANSRMYYTQEPASPNDLHWDRIDPSSGKITATGRTPYFGIPVLHPIRVSRDGAYVLLGTGTLYDGTTLVRGSSLPQPITDALWTDDGVVTIRPDSSGGTLLEDRRMDLSLRNEVRLTGAPLRLVEAAGEIVAVTMVAGRPEFRLYAPSDDGDGDGVTNSEDAFPLDPSASRDRDRDGAPDAWNPGYGPGDSIDGLTLDAFPDDFACQLPEHGVGGVCDFPNVLPRSVDEPLCEVDSTLPSQSPGVAAFGAHSDFVPLCDGWMLIGDRDHDRIEILNAVNGRTGASFPLPSTPGDLDLDEEHKLLYAALPEQLALARLDLLSGELRMIPVALNIDSITSGPGGGLFLSVGASNDSKVYWLAPGAVAPSGGWPVTGRPKRWNAVRHELVAGTIAGLPWSLSRYAFQPTTGLSLLQSVSGVGVSGGGGDLAVSRDGLHVAFEIFTGSLNSFAVNDFVASDLTSRRGAWPSSFSATRTAFDPASTRLVAVNDFLRVYDVASFASLASYRLPTCAYSNVSSVAFSRGGALAIVRETCGSGAVTRYHWLVMP